VALRFAQNTNAERFFASAKIPKGNLKPRHQLKQPRKIEMPVVNLVEMPLEAIYNSRHQLKQPCKTEMPVVNLVEMHLEANHQI